MEDRKIALVKSLSKALLAVYLFVLLWIVLFKFSYDPIRVLLYFQSTNLNLIPFALAHKGEMISNLIVFVPLGVLVGVNFKQFGFWHKLAAISALSLVVEIVQLALAIGVADITDLIMNTLGGLIGLAAYEGACKFISPKYLDLVILVMGSIILLGILYLRIFVFRVQY